MSVSDRPGFSIGIDTGGTFVDCVVVGPDGQLVAEKSLSTPSDLTAGVNQVLDRAARSLSMTTNELLAATTRLVHGTTVGLNALVSRQGSRVGLITTRGHEDAILIGRVHQKVAGLSPEQLAHAAALNKPEPLVPRQLIRGVDERIDYAGAIVAPLDEQGLAAAARELVNAGVQALAVCFLWSFKNPAHERRARGVIGGLFPQLPVALSHEAAPVLGEYERTTTTVVNAYLDHVVTGYLEKLRGDLQKRGLRAAPSVVASSGGIDPMAMVIGRASETLGSGPAGGIMATVALGQALGANDVIGTDVGGTSFEVGLVVDGEPSLTGSPVFEQLHLARPAIDVRSIGAGGGSIAWIGADGTLRVGPRSAGSEPGPACYGLGGNEPTVTDADLVLGRLNPAGLLGGDFRLDRGAAERALRTLGPALGMDDVGVASAIVRVIDAEMADLVRAIMAERGHDPRRFVMIAYGGSAPLHVGGYAPDVGVPEVVVSPLAPVFSALGLAQADYRRVYIHSEPVRLPGDPAPLQRTLHSLEEEARGDFARSGLRSDLRIDRIVDMRFRRQTHEVGVPLPAGPIDEAAIATLCDRFAVEYERMFGPGSAYRDAGIEADRIRVVATAPTGWRSSRSGTSKRGGAGRPDPSGQRDVYFTSWQKAHVFDASQLRPGHEIDGPAVIDGPGTSLLIHPGQRAEVDPLVNVHLHLGNA
jgi:N-methylhydantoinase A